MLTDPEDSGRSILTAYAATPIAEPGIVGNRFSFCRTLCLCAQKRALASSGEIGIQVQSESQGEISNAATLLVLLHYGLNAFEMLRFGLSSREVRQRATLLMIILFFLRQSERKMIGHSLLADPI